MLWVLAIHVWITAPTIGYVGSMPFRVIYDHKHGLARSNPLTAEAALNMARTWVRDGEEGVRIEDEDTGEVWTVEGFTTKVR
jgi:hypothetical protein